MAQRNESAESTGFLQVTVTTGGIAYPVYDATVTVEESQNGETVLRALRQTDISGVTDVVSLPSPPLSASASPGGNPMPYSVFDVSVRREEYYPMKVTGVAIFPGITSLQAFSLIPLSPGAAIEGTAGETVIYRIPKPLGPDAREGTSRGV